MIPTLLMIIGTFCINGQIESRTVVQDGGDWVINYKIRVSPQTITPSSVSLQYNGLVYNTSVPGHSVVRRSSAEVAGFGDCHTAILPGDKEQQCGETVLLAYYNPATQSIKPRIKTIQDSVFDALKSCRIDRKLNIRIRIEHDHFLYGPYHPLLGSRDVSFSVGSVVVYDHLNLDRCHEVIPATIIPVFAADRMDDRHYFSAPDSLILEAAQAGDHYVRVPEFSVKYNTQYKISFRYRVATGTEGNLRVRVAQYRDGPSGWQVLHQGGFEQDCMVVGRWALYERVFTTERDCTSMAIDLRIYGADEVGEVWIDDLTITPLQSRSNP